MPIRVRATPLTMETIAVVWIAPRMRAKSWCPICTATTTFAPIDSPTNKETNKAIIGATPPTAAHAALSIN